MYVTPKATAESDSPRWRISVAVRITVTDPTGVEVTPRGSKPRAIIACLWSQGGQARREQLLDLLWGDRGEDQARASLRQALLQIRKSVGGKLLGTDRRHVWLEAAEIDLPDTQELIPDELLTDLNGVTPALDEWLGDVRRNWANSAWTVLQAEAEQLLERGLAQDALPLIEQMERLDSLNEDRVRLAMLAEYQADRPAGVDRHFREMEDRLRRELGIGPAKSTRELRDQLIAELTGEQADDQSGERE